MSARGDRCVASQLHSSVPPGRAQREPQGHAGLTTKGSKRTGNKSEKAALAGLPCAHGPSRAASLMLPCYVREANEWTTSWIIAGRPVLPRKRALYHLIR